MHSFSAFRWPTRLRRRLLSLSSASDTPDPDCISPLHTSSAPMAVKDELLAPAGHAAQRQQHTSASADSSPSLSATDTRSSRESNLWSESVQSSDAESPDTPTSETYLDDARAALDKTAEVDVTSKKAVGASTTLLTQDPSVLRDSSGVDDDSTGAQLFQKYCCGGGCCLRKTLAPVPAGTAFTPLDVPANNAFMTLNVNVGDLNRDTELTGLADLPPSIVAFEPAQAEHQSTVDTHPPAFVQPHPPHSVFSAPVYHVRELTKPGAEKRTFHFDIDVTDYPEEDGVDFKVGGAIGVCPANNTKSVDEVFDLLGVPRSLRDRPVTLKTSGTRWPTIWGEEQARSLLTTRRELLSWCSDIQSYPPTKAFFRLLAESATDPNETKVLHFLASAEGQAAFCELRSGPHLSLIQLLHAFPSARPRLEDLLSVQQQLMPRFYSLSNDPHVSAAREGLAGRRLIEVAVTIHNKPSWRGRPTAGVGSGYLERIAMAFAEAEESGAPAPKLRVPMFRGLMANPITKFGATDGPMMLVGAGVGMAPFRGFILNRLREANCASKIWLVQGIRNAEHDELYSGELGKYEHKIKKVVQSRNVSRANSMTPSVVEELKTRAKSLAPSTKSRLGSVVSTSQTDLAPDNDAADPKKVAAAIAAAHEQWKASQGEARYVQDELRQQGDVVWDIIHHDDGRIFVVGGAGMGEGVDDALIDISMEKGGFTREAAKNFWKEMTEQGKYIAEIWN